MTSSSRSSDASLRASAGSTAGAVHPDRDVRRANPLGAYVAILGIIVFVASVFLDWVVTDVQVGPGGQVTNDKQAFSGYEADAVIPWLAFFGIGLALALLYALGRARRRQHRGLTLVTLAAGASAALLALAYLIDPPAVVGVDRELSGREIGVYLGLVGGVIWAVGSALFAGEPEGDPEDDDLRRPVGAGDRAAV